MSHEGVTKKISIGIVCEDRLVHDTVGIANALLTPQVGSDYTLAYVNKETRQEIGIEVRSFNSLDREAEIFLERAKDTGSL